MANPPITIPPFNNVPAPGSPIRSDWPQQITTYAVGKVDRAGDIMSGALSIGKVPNAATGDTGVRSQPSGIVQAYATATGVASLWLTRMGTAANVGEVLARFGRTSADTVCGTIAITGATTVAYNTSSDPRFKLNDGPISDAAERVHALAAGAFRGRLRDVDDDGNLTDTSSDVHPWDFLSSVDVAAVAPYAVTGDADALDDDGRPVAQQVNFAGLVPLLVAALGDALDRIDLLEAGS